MRTICEPLIRSCVLQGPMNELWVEFHPFSRPIEILRFFFKNADWFIFFLKLKPKKIVALLATCLGEGWPASLYCFAFLVPFAAFAVYPECAFRSK